MDEDDGAQNPLLEANGNVKQTHNRLSANQLKQLVLVLSLFQNVASHINLVHEARFEAHILKGPLCSDCIQGKY